MTPALGADLHRHLDGSLRPETLRALAQARGLSVPPDLCFRPGMGLQAALASFAFILELLQEPQQVTRVAREICEDALAEGVAGLELRFAPQLHQGGTIPSVVDAALEGLQGRAGLILCALYGEPPEVVEALVEAAASRPGVVGLDLAGGPIPEHRYGMRDYAPAFQRAASLGLGRTVHAGEGRPPAEIGDAIRLLKAQRIGHGVSLLRDPALVDLVLAEGVTLEACLTSNLQTGCIPSVEAHPLLAWLEAGILVAVCTDNTLLSGVTLASEMQLAASLPGMTPAFLERLRHTSLGAGFQRS